MTERTPSEAGAARMSALARLPVFLALERKRAVIAGGSAAAAWKAELLAAAGAQVEPITIDFMFIHIPPETVRAETLPRSQEQHPRHGAIRPDRSPAMIAGDTWIERNLDAAS